MSTKEAKTKQNFKLPNKKIRVTANIKPTSFIKDTNHVASFLAPGANNTYPTPYLRNGQFANVLTDEEKSFFEDKDVSGLSFDKGDLSVYKKNDNFWKMFSVTLNKDDVILDLSTFTDYVKWKVLSLYKDEIASSKESLKYKVTYKYLMVDMDEEVNDEAMEADLEERAYGLLAELKNDRPKMISYLRVAGKKPSDTSTDNFLITQIRNIIKSGKKGMLEFVNTITDPDFGLKVMIEKAVRAKAVIKNRNKYSLPEGDTIAVSTTDLVRYLKDSKNQDVLMLIEERVKNAE